VIAITCKVKQEEDNDSGDYDDGNDDPPEEPTPPIELPQVPPFG
jgi:hypothetical protein